MEITTPEDAGFSSQRLSRIRPAMQRYIEREQVAGMITLLARRGQIAYLDCLGMSHIEAGKPMTPDTIFRIYSMTKPITAVAAMMLYEEGAFLLHEPVSTFIPAFKTMEVFVRESDAGLKTTEAAQSISIWNLLTHTSGLSYGFDHNSVVDRLYRDLYTAYNLVHNECIIHPDAPPLADVVPQFAALPLVAEPGTQWHYSISTDVLGYLVEIVSAMPFAQFLQERIFEPLGMKDTGFYVPPEQSGRLAALYAPSEAGGLKLLDDPDTSLLRRPPKFQSGGGGLLSTIFDYLRFAQMLLNKGTFDGTRLLSRKTVEFMTMNHLKPAILGPNFTRGHGKGLGVKSLIDLPESGCLGSEGMYGKGGVARTYFWIDPQEDLIGLIMLQLLGKSPISVSDAFKGLTYQAIVD